MSYDCGTTETAAARADYLVADAVLRNRSRTGASPGASCRGAPARGHTGFAAIHFFGRARGRVSCNDTTSNRELDQRLARAGPSEGTLGEAASRQHEAASRQQIA